MNYIPIGWLGNGLKITHIYENWAAELHAYCTLDKAYIADMGLGWIACDIIIEELD